MQRYARPEVVLGRNPGAADKSSDGDEDGDTKMDGGESSEGGFLSESEDADS